jgi:hypothetical protein
MCCLRAKRPELRLSKRRKFDRRQQRRFPPAIQHLVQEVTHGARGAWTDWPRVKALLGSVIDERRISDIRFCMLHEYLGAVEYHLDAAGQIVLDARLLAYPELLALKLFHEAVHQQHQIEGSVEGEAVVLALETLHFLCLDRAAQRTILVQHQRLAAELARDPRARTTWSFRRYFARMRRVGGAEPVSVVEQALLQLQDNGYAASATRVMKDECWRERLVASLERVLVASSR